MEDETAYQHFLHFLCPFNKVTNRTISEDGPIQEGNRTYLPRCFWEGLSANSFMIFPLHAGEA